LGERCRNGQAVDGIGTCFEVAEAGLLLLHCDPDMPFFEMKLTSTFFVTVPMEGGR
jgi:hypothetical protein